MSKRHAYSYSLLKYVHDPLAGETVNVGVAVFSKDAFYSQFKFRNTFGRFSGVFPDLDGEAFKSSLKALERGLNKVSKKQTGDLFAGYSDAREFGRAGLPADDSSFAWSENGYGLSADLDAQLDALYSRFVTQYDGTKKHHRADADVWRPVRELLADRKLEDRLETKVISSSVDRVEFEHAWKNGIWHCYQPLSLDLASEDSIRDKARRWVGQITTVADATEKFQPYFLVGRPQERALWPACDAAVAMLRQSPVEPEVYFEDQVKIFVDKIEDEISHHDQGLS